MGASVIVHAGAALAAFDYAVTRDLGVALRILPAVVLLAPMVGAVGCVIGCFVGMLASVFEQRAAKAAASGPDGQAGENKPRRRALLARLAVCLLVAGVVAALYSPVAYELTRRRAVLTIRAVGGQVSFDASRRVRIAEHAGPLGDLLSWIDVRDHNQEREGWFYSLESAFSVWLPPGATDEHLAHVFDLPEVTYLTLRETNVTTAGLERVAAELTLFALDFSHTSVSPEALGCLARAASLSRLDLSHSRITDEGLRQLAGAASLRILFLRDTPVTDEGLGHLSGLGLLTHLDLRGTLITDDGLRHVGQMASLRSLVLEETGITSAGLTHLRPIQGLMRLNLSNTRLHGQGLGQLAGLPATFAPGARQSAPG